MTKQQLLALLREAIKIALDDGSTLKGAEDRILAEIERTNKVGDLELPDIDRFIEISKVIIIWANVGIDKQKEKMNDEQIMIANKITREFASYIQQPDNE